MADLKMQTFVARYPERPDEFVFAYPDYVARVGGLESFEAGLAKNCLWYANLGEITYSWEGSSALLIPVPLLQDLMDSWEQKGEAKTVGKGELPQYLRDIETNPIIPCVLLELLRAEGGRYIRINLR